MKLLPYGDAAVLVEPDNPSSVLGMSAAVAEDADVIEVVPAARTFLVRTTPEALGRVRARLPGLEPPSGGARPDGVDPVVLDVRYDGADLAATAGELGLDSDGLVRRHSAGHYVVAFCGFAPGFAYLSGLEPALHVDRLPEPRIRVPAGSVGIAGEFTGVYPRVSPGGWRLLGTTDARLWDVRRTPPALLVPGTAVRFRPR